MPTVGPYTINFTDPVKGQFQIAVDTVNGPLSPIRVLPAPPLAISASTSLLLYGHGVPGYGERIAEDFVNLLENFAGPAAPVRATHGQLWYDTGEFITILATDTSLETITILGDYTSIFKTGVPFKTVQYTIDGTNDVSQVLSWTCDNDSTLSSGNTIIKVNTNITAVFTNAFVSYTAPIHRLKIFNDPNYDGIGNWISASGCAFMGTGPLLGDVPAIGDIWFDSTTTPPTIKIHNGTVFVDALLNLLHKTYGGVITGDVTFDGEIEINDLVTSTNATIVLDSLEIDGLDAPSYAYVPAGADHNKAVNVLYIQAAVADAIARASSGGGTAVLKTGDTMTGTLEWDVDNAQAGLRWHQDGPGNDVFRITNQIISWSSENNLIFDASVASRFEGFEFRHPRTLGDYVMKISGQEIISNVDIIQDLPPTIPSHLTNKEYVDAQIDSIKTQDVNLTGQVNVQQLYEIAAVGTDYIEINTATYPLAQYNFRHDATLKIIDTYNNFNEGVYEVRVITGSPSTLRVSLINAADRVAITSIAVTTNTTATVTTESDHGWTGTPAITITGAYPPTLNGTFTITVTGLNTFTYTCPSTANATAPDYGVSSTVPSIATATKMVPAFITSGLYGSHRVKLNAGVEDVGGSPEGRGILLNDFIVYDGDISNSLFGGADCNYRIWLNVDGVDVEYNTTGATINGQAAPDYADLIASLNADGAINVTATLEDDDVDEFVVGNDRLQLRADVDGAKVIIRDDDPHRTHRRYIYALTTIPLTPYTATGLANDSTQYGFRIFFQSGLDYEIIAFGSEIQTYAQLITKINTVLGPSAWAETIDEMAWDNVNGIKFTNLYTEQSMYITDGVAIGSPTVLRLFAHLKTDGSPSYDAFDEFVVPLLPQLYAYTGLDTPKHGLGHVSMGLVPTSPESAVSKSYIDWAVHSDRIDTVLGSNIIGTEFSVPDFAIGYKELTVYHEGLLKFTNTYTEKAKFAVSTLTRDGVATATVTTTQPHWLLTNDEIEITGASFGNGSRTITVINQTQFTFPLAGGAGSATGTIFCQHSIPHRKGNMIVVGFATANNDTITVMATGRRFTRT